MIQFSSDAYENITYFNEVALKLLSLMGHSGTVPGALKANEVAGALAQLQQGLGKAKDRVLKQNDDEDEISLAKRALPLQKMLEAAIKKGADVLWS